MELRLAFLASTITTLEQHRRECESLTIQLAAQTIAYVLRTIGFAIGWLCVKPFSRQSTGPKSLPEIHRLFTLVVSVFSQLNTLVKPNNGKTCLNRRGGLR